jgi:hypothetical protein
MADSPDHKIFSPAFAEHLHQSPPDFLYHYTTQQGLLGIVDSGTLWATNIGYLNDATEFGLALGLIRDRLLNEVRESEMEASHFASADPPRARHANERKAQAQTLFTHTNSTHSPICVICFCERGDLLSQWRGYAGDGYGYSLAFSPSKLEIIRGNWFLLGKCIYDLELQKEIVNESLEYILAGKPRPIHAEQNNGQTLPKELTAFSDIWPVFTYGAFFKHPSFQEEQEWRLVSTTPYPPLFRKGKSMIIPYTPLRINCVPNDGIDHVFVGPCPHMQLSVRSVSDMLILKGFYVGVHPSSIPFRDW